jgi:hypothetical protein
MKRGVGADHRLRVGFASALERIHELGVQIKRVAGLRGGELSNLSTLEAAVVLWNSLRVIPAPLPAKLTFLNSPALSRALPSFSRVLGAAPLR